MVDVEWLRANDFLHMHSLRLRCSPAGGLSELEIVDAPGYKGLGDRKYCPATYIWLQRAADDQRFEVLYVGKAGYGVRRRQQQHVGWFNANSDVQSKKSQRLAEFQKGEVLVYARLTNNITLWGQAVPLYATEEHALYQLFAPTKFNAPHGFPFGCIPSGPEAGIRPDDAAVNAPPIDGEQHDEIKEADIYTDPKFLDFIRKNPTAAPLANQIVQFLDGWKILGLYDLQHVGGYTSQPRFCNGIETFSLCRLGDKRAVGRSWAVRIPLHVVPIGQLGAGDPIICFPIEQYPGPGAGVQLKILKDGPWLQDPDRSDRFTASGDRVIIVNTGQVADDHPTGVDQLTNGVSGYGGIFRPENVSHFLAHPAAYVDQKELLKIYPNSLP